MICNFFECDGFTFLQIILSYSMVLILLLLLCNPDNLILKLNSYLHEGWLFIDSFKVGSVPRMINKEMLVQFIYNPA